MSCRLSRPNHPATFPKAVLDVIDELLGDAAFVLDPFAGTGGIHALYPRRFTVGVEIEPEWAGHHERTVVGDSRRLPFDAGSFDAVATSPAYGNRYADKYDGRDGSHRVSYRIALGRPLSEGNGAALQWGDEYRQLHRQVWREGVRVLKPGGRLVLNIKDHIRKGGRQHVTRWHVRTLRGLGLLLEDERQIKVPGNAHFTNPRLRVSEESVILFRR